MKFLENALSTMLIWYEIMFSSESAYSPAELPLDSEGR